MLKSSAPRSDRGAGTVPYNGLMPCLICHKRKEKRFCPAKAGKICTTCCAIEREETIDCPFDCPHLQEGRLHEHAGALDPDNFPYKEIRIGESFLRDHEDLLIACGRAVLSSALETPSATDRDTREALDALIQTYKTLESGIYYETRPESAYGREIMGRIQQQLREFKENETQQTGFSRTRDSDIRTLLVFLFRMALDRDNGRRRGKAFLDFLRQHFKSAGAYRPSSAFTFPRRPRKVFPRRARAVFPT
jgi:hypothetical protein